MSSMKRKIILGHKLLIIPIGNLNLDFYFFPKKVDQPQYISISVPLFVIFIFRK